MAFDTSSYLKNILLSSLKLRKFVCNRDFSQEGLRKLMQNFRTTIDETIVKSSTIVTAAFLLIAIN
jgi:hypothetical protein